MKTPLETLIEKLQVCRSGYTSEIIITSLDLCETIAETLLAQEREEIENAWESGNDEGFNMQSNRALDEVKFSDSNEYFKTTYEK